MLHVKYYIFLPLLFILASGFYGCTLKEEVKPRLIDTIIIKNSTAQHIKKVTLSDSNGRTGTISPIAEGIEQIYGRGSRVNRLTDTLHIHWIDATNNVYQKQLITTPYMDSSHDGKTIVFELLPYGNVKVFRK